MVTLKEIAKLANVSIATVSYVINGSDQNISKETREKILKLINELDYRPNRFAKSLRTSKTHTVGIIAEDITVFNTPEIINGIGEYVEQFGYNVILNNLRLYKKVGDNHALLEKNKNQIISSVKGLFSNEIDGLLYIGIHYREVTEIIQTLNKPTVYTYCFSNDENAYNVYFDDEHISYEVTRYLHDLGHTKMAIITGLLDSIASNNRIKGFQKFVNEKKLTLPKDFIQVGDWEYQSGYEKAMILLKMIDRPTAIFAMNDVMAGGVIDAANELGIHIPNQLSVVGFDNREFSYSYIPKLTTVELPLNEMGKESARILIDAIEKRTPDNKHIILKCKIIYRDSVSAPMKLS